MMRIIAIEGIDEQLNQLHKELLIAKLEADGHAVKRMGEHWRTNQHCDFVVTSNYILSFVVYGVAHGIGRQIISRIASRIWQPDIDIVIDMPAEEVAGMDHRHGDMLFDSGTESGLMNIARHHFILLPGSAAAPLKYIVEGRQSQSQLLDSIYHIVNDNLIAAGE